MIYKFPSNLMNKYFPSVKSLCLKKDSSFDMQMYKNEITISSEDNDKRMTIKLQGIQQDNDQELNISIQATTFFDIIRKNNNFKSPDQDFWELEEHEGYITLKKDKGKAKLIKGIQHTKNEIQTPQSSFKIKVEELQKGLKNISFAMSNDDRRPQLKSALIRIKFDENQKYSEAEMVATDNYRLAVQKIELNDVKIDETEHNLENKQINILIPQKTLSVINQSIDQSDNEITINFNKNLITFSGSNKEDNSSWFMSSGLVNAKYPEYQGAFKSEPKTIVNCNAYELYKAVDQVSVVSYDNQIVSLKISKESIVVSSSNVKFGEYTTSIYSSSNNDEEYLINFRSSLLLELIKTFNKSEIRMNIISNNAPAMINSDDKENFKTIIVALKY